ncbi:sensor histidine kinase [Fodinicola acaciae]|uniref:sensor histidine kinase n=1 Tax=Fodinicola acaciae TaxID=2681555 RepID=UPI001C9E2D5C|nr:HAMP domain-containing sensor histidine kinase [Fodinicola acaciae]
MKVPRWTARLRLALMYCGMSVASGAVLLLITYLLVVYLPPNAVFLKQENTTDGPVLSGGVAGPPVNVGALLGVSAIALVIVAFLALALGWEVAGGVLRPLRTITTRTRRISATNLQERLALDGPADELHELADTIDALLGRLEAAFDAQRQFVANASHELRTPLTRQRALIEVALDDPEATISSMRAACRRVLAAGDQQERLIEGLLTLASSQRGPGRRERLDLAVLASDTVDRAGAEDLKVEVELAPAPAYGDPRLVERLVTNLVDNAVRHNVLGGWIRITTRREGDRSVLTVANGGPVLPRAEIARLFQPFQRFDAERTGVRDGHGLGLSIVAAIADAHNAELRADPGTDGGLTVWVAFPAR